MIAFDFDRAKTQRQLMTYSAILLGGFVLMLLPWVLSLSRVIGQSWGWAITVFILLIGVHLTDYARWLGICRRGLRRQGTALVVNQAGIIDNASEYTLGQLNWGEIEKMYSWDWNSRIFVNWWRRMPIISKQRGVMVIFKDGVDFSPRLRDKPWIIRSSFNDRFTRGRRRWIFIPDILLTVTADELMAQLNRFYIAEVRGAV